MKTDEIIELLRLRNHLTRVIVENKHYLTIRPLESVKAYNRQLEAELSAVERIIKGELT